MNPIVETFLNNVELTPNKMLFQYKDKSVTYQEVLEQSSFIATSLIATNSHKTVAIYCDRSIWCLASMFACVLANVSYTVLDVHSPLTRVQKILELLDSDILLTCKEDALIVPMELIGSRKVIVCDELCVKEEELIQTRQLEYVSSNVMYILFTSGSTGTPKGAVISYDNLIHYQTWFMNCFDITKDTIFASQTPFYFSMSVSDVFATILAGASLVILSKSDFSFPVRIVEQMNRYLVNTIYWVPSAYGIFMFYDLFKYMKFNTLRKCLFAGEVMNTKFLDYWRKNNKDCLFANLFGPTETTDICTYYKIGKDEVIHASVPIGISCEGIDSFLWNEDHIVTSPDEQGELYVRGAFVGLGYFKNKEKTLTTFVQNPAQNNYPEIVYKTGDLCCYNNSMQLIYAGRSDYQIKHQGNRIELGEIEQNVLTIDAIQSVIALYNKEEDNIILIYQGKIKIEELIPILNITLVSYMVPQVVKKVQNFIFNANGKIDRKWYNENYKTM